MSGKIEKSSGKLGKLLVENKMLLILVFIEIIVLSLVNYRLLEPVDKMMFSAQELYEMNPDIDMEFSNGRITISDLGEAVAVRSPKFTLYPGSYTMTMSYESNKDGRGSITESTGQITYWAKDNRKGLLYDQPFLYDGKDKFETRVLVKSLGEMEDSYFLIMYTGAGTLSFGDVQLEESMSYRILMFVFSVFIALLINVAYYLWHKNTKCANSYVQKGAYIVAIAFGASLPFLASYLYMGHDLSFHLNRITMLAAELENGQFPVRITRDYFMNQYGYANALFYCDFFLYIPAILYNFGVSLFGCYQVYIVGSNLVTAFIAYYSFKKMTNQGWVSMIGAAVYTLSYYRLICLYTRAALGEYTAMAFLPLIVAGMYLIYTNEKIKFRDWILLTIGMSGVILSHVLTTQMVVIFLVITCMICIKRTIQLRRIIALIKASVVTVLLTGWFVLPMLQSMDMGIVMVENTTDQIQQRGLSLAQLFSIPITSFGGTEANNMLREISIGLWVLVGLGCICYCCLKSKEWKIVNSHKARAMMIMGVLGVLALVITLQWFPWDSLDGFIGEDAGYFMRNIQFPFRYLTIASIMVVTSTLFALQFCSHKNIEVCRGVVVLLLAFTMLSAGEYYGKYTQEASCYTGAYRVDIPVVYSDYLLEDADIKEMAVSNVQVSDSALLVDGYKQKEGNVLINLCNISERSIEITLPVLGYDNYVLSDLVTNEEYQIHKGENGCIAAEIPPFYEGTLVLSYQPPFSWRVAEIISLITLFLIGVFAVYRWRSDEPCN